MFRKDASRRRLWRGRAVSLFLTAALLLGMAPGLTLPASADHWADPYLDQLVDWGVIRADQAGDPDAPITRAEFMAVVNRAYGYTEMGPIPFTDVSPGDWYYDDVAIAYTAGYMKGTSETTASPNASLTREQAVCILGRNMMLKETPGEDLAFADSRSISGWARGMIKTAVNNYIVNGYPDDTFRPQTDITKGQMAALMTQCVGLPISESGVSTLGDVSGNVTITAPNVTLRGTTISGDLYISGGVGLGSIKLENVNVLGRIIVSGTGESEGGSASVIMRNVTANELLVDNMRKKYVTVRADGITEIAKTTVRTNAYLEDNNTDDKGLMRIELDGGSGTRLDLAGRIKKVVDKTPNSFVQMAKGTAQSITVDEEATNSVIQINRNTEVKELNLDVAARVNGEGDVGRLNINAPGSTVTMLPDNIYIRPGITGNVNGVVMDSAAAEESSLGPRLLSGYPAANDLAPTALRADFSGNKKGTVYWGVSSVSDGSIGASDLISPPSYGSKAVRGGSLSLPTGDTVGSAKISGLTVGGSYYLSAVLVDGQGERSPVKVISFTTPDNTVPAFAQGYPYMSLVSDSMAQVTVMPTKTCKLYYAVLLKGAKAPTANELRSAAVTGNLGYGVVDVVKNTERVINVSNRLQELKDYTLYLLLSDVDGGKSSAVTSLQFKTVDKTAPEFVMHPQVNGNPKPTSVPMTATINENGTIYWAVVQSGTDYPKPNGQNTADNTPDGKTALLTSYFAKLQVSKGMSALKSGSVRATANTEATFNITGLQAESAYDLYYVAQDAAGNYSKEVGMITIHTLDTSKPTVTQAFTSMNGDDPMANTDIKLIFSEDMAYGGTGLRELYNKAKAANFAEKSQAMKDYMEVLHKTITFYQYIQGVYEAPRDYRDGPKVYTELDIGRTISGKTLTADDVVIDFRKAVIENGEEGEMVLRFPNGGLKLVTGNTYFFVLSGLTDTSSAKNPLDTEDKNEVDYHTVKRNGLRRFSIALATVQLQQTDAPDEENDPFTDADGDKEIDISFYMKPNGTEQVDNDIKYDLLFWSQERLAFDIYIRVVNAQNGKPITDGKNYVYPAYSKTGDNRTDMPNSKITGVKAMENGWVYMGNTVKTFNPYDEGTREGTSLYGKMMGLDVTKFPRLNTLEEKWGSDTNLWYEVGICLTQVGDQTRRGSWSLDYYTVDVNVAAGGSTNLGLLKSPSEESWARFKSNGGSSIGDPMNPKPNESDTQVLEDSIGNTQVPQFRTPRPTFTAETSTVDITVNLDGEGWVYYLIAPVVNATEKPGIETTAEVNGTKLTDMELFDFVPTKGGTQNGDESDLNISEKDSTDPNRYIESGWVTAPAADRVQTPRTYNNSYLRYDKVRYYRGGGDVTLGVTKQGEHTATGLEPDQEYFCYIVLAGLTDPTGTHSYTYLYKFKTKETTKPRISPDDQETGTIKVSTGEAAEDARVEANLAWRVLTSSQAVQVLNKSLELSDEAKAAGVTGYLGVSTVWDALNSVFTPSQAVPANSFGTGQDGYSVFDVLASPTQKYALGRLIYYGDGSFVVGSGVTLERVNSGTASTAKRQDYTTDINWWKTANAPTEDVEYTFLVAGHNTANNSIASSGGGQVDYSTVDSYRLSKVINRDRTPPQLRDGQNGANGSMNYVAVGETDGVFNGNINLSFNKAVGWKPVNLSTVYAVQPGSGKVEDATPFIRGTAGRIGILYGLKVSPGRIYTDEGMSTEAKSQFTLKFEGVRAGTYQLLTNGQISTLNGEGNKGSTITIRLVEKATRDITLPSGEIISEGSPYATVTFPTVGDTDNRGNVDQTLRTHYIMVSGRTTHDPSVSLDSDNFTLNTQTNKTRTLTANVAYPPSNPTATVWSWSSSNPAAATVSGNTGGPVTVTAVSEGKATITATVKYTIDGVVSTYQASVDVNVESPSLSISPTSTKIKKGETVTLTADARNGSDSVTWSTNDTKATELSASSGNTIVVTGKDYGSATITATYAGQSATAVVKVQPGTVAVTIKGIPPQTQLNRGTEYRLTAEVKIDGVVDNKANVEWSTSDSSKATIDSTGLLKVIGNDQESFTITATYTYPGSTTTVTDKFNRQIVETISTAQGLTTIPK